MTQRTRIVAVAIMGAMLATGASAQSAKDVLGATPWATVDNEPPPRLVVDPPLAEPLSRGVFIAQYRTENIHIAPVVGAGALAASPRIGHVHISVDNLPWNWAAADDTNTIVVAGFPPGPHQIRVALADPTHRELWGSQTVQFVVPEGAHHPMH